MENNTCFTIKNLSFSYDKKQILNQLNLFIPKGKVVTIMGANGCGKSTFFQLLTKNLKPSDGNIFFENKALNQISLPEFAKKVAVVHQNNTAPPDITVEQLVSYGRIPYKKPRHASLQKKDTSIVTYAMKITGIYSLRNQTIGSLSGGQRQRAWIAMALAQGTKILLLDEPTTYLDIKYQLQILRLVQSLNKKCHISIIMILHDINQAIAYSDEIIYLSPSGSLIAQGSPNKIVTTALLEKVYGITLDVFEKDQKKIVLTQ